MLVGSVESGSLGVSSTDYTAITGAIDHSTAVVKENPPSPHMASGIQSAGGVLSANKCLTFASITDGASNTILIGEQSDWCLSASGEKQNCRSDCGHSFTIGATPTAAGDDRWFNTIALCACFVAPQDRQKKSEPSAVPAKYRNATTSGLKVMVKQGVNPPFDFDLR